MMEEVVNKYVKYLKVKREEPSLNYLQRLIQHHLTYIPYETFSKFYYYTLAPDYIPPLPLFVDNLVEKGWGGTCFTLNMNFARLLTELGYECSLVKVEPGHIAIMVEIKDRKFYVDVGYGSPIMKPIELDKVTRLVMHGFGEEIIFTKQSSHIFEIDRRSNGKTFVKKQIIWEPLSEDDIRDDIRASYFDSDDNITMRRITAVRFNGQKCFYLRNGTMKVMTFRNISEIKMNETDKWVKHIHEIYQIDKTSLLESLDFLAERNVKIF
ncbi:arylamine N-acetyltransferase [Lederbergia graminis]|uniref:Arylamine N-acetyltransferase n=2 Tax=Lederbergia graminis TaxID=735518 RepID=A0ABW0LJD2_9BACI